MARRKPKSRKAKFDEQAESFMHLTPESVSDPLVAAIVLRAQRAIVQRLLDESLRTNVYRAKPIALRLKPGPEIVRFWVAADADCVTCLAIEIAPREKVSFENPLAWV